MSTIEKRKNKHTLNSTAQHTYLRWPADPGKYENFALLLKYNSSKVVQAAISSGRPRRLFEARDNFSIAVMYCVIVVVLRIERGKGE